MLSGHDYTFNANGDSVFVTSKGTGWGFSDVMLDSAHYFLPIADSNCKLVYIDSNFQIERRNCNTIFVKMNMNKTNSVRTLWVSLEAGDYFSSILFTQKKQ
jgi:hypothetical protein